FFANLDLSLIYTTDVMGSELQLKGTVYNVLNTDTVVAVNQTGTLTNDAGETVHNPEWGNASALQGSRWVSLTAQYRF
ncbi:MAG: hypothetical protein HRT35_16170, partial [Algicola sp.]|nr:hypothetical protein [Algicola sp.]